MNIRVMANSKTGSLLMFTLPHPDNHIQIPNQPIKHINSPINNPYPHHKHTGNIDTHTWLVLPYAMSNIIEQIELIYDCDG